MGFKILRVATLYYQLSVALADPQWGSDTGNSKTELKMSPLLQSLSILYTFDVYVHDTSLISQWKQYKVQTGFLGVNKVQDMPFFFDFLKSFMIFDKQ